jgi:hypothetical protein
VFVRIAKFEGTAAEGVDATRAQIEEDMSSGNTPEGLEDATEVMLLVDREAGTSLGVVFFETEDDLRRGDEALNAMSPDEGGGQRSRVEMYEVAFRATPSRA